jgi:hypothetical protein
MRAAQLLLLLSALTMSGMRNVMSSASIRTDRDFTT